MKPPAGYYRKFLPNDLSHVKLAYVHIPMSNVEERLDLVPIIESHFGELGTSLNDLYLLSYQNMLKNGSIVPIVEKSLDKVYRSGELYFST